MVAPLNGASDPGAQGLQGLDDPGTLLKDPSEQSPHSSLRVCVATLPEGQSVQPVEPRIFVYFPKGQSTHPTLPLST